MTNKHRIVRLSEFLHVATANAVIGAVMGYGSSRVIQPGDVTLVIGATGVTGRVAVTGEILRRKRVIVP